MYSIVNTDSHGNAWIHKCPVFSCKFTSYNRPDFKKHVKLHKSGELRIRKCGFKGCPKIFMGSEDYKEHMREMHGMLVRKVLAQAALLKKSILLIKSGSCSGSLKSAQEVGL